MNNIDNIDNIQNLNNSIVNNLNNLNNRNDILSTQDDIDLELERITNDLVFLDLLN